MYFSCFFVDFCFFYTTVFAVITKAGWYTGIPKHTNGINQYNIHSRAISVYRQFPVYRKFPVTGYIKPRVMAMASNTCNASSSGSNSASSSIVNLLSKPKATSLVCEHFRFKPDETELKPQKKDRAVCCLCKHSVEAKSENTSNQFSHLRV